MRPPFEYDGPACDSYSKVGLEIAARLPIAGRTATNDECIARHAAVLAALIESELPTGSAAHPQRLQGASGPLHSWYTCVLDDGMACGCWADSAGEAIIVQALWRGRPVVRVEADHDGSLLVARRARRTSVEVTLW